MAAIKEKTVSAEFKRRAEQKNAKAAIAKFANVTSGVAGLAVAFKELMPHFTRDDSYAVLVTVDALQAARRKAQGIVSTKEEKLGEIKASRASEMASILTLRDWVCHNQLMDMLGDLEAPRDTIVYVSKQVRKLEKNATLPKRATVIGWINERKAQRNSDGGGKSNIKINPTVAITAIEAHLVKLQKTYGKAEGASFISAMLKACKSYAPIAEKIAAAAAEKKAAEKAKKKGGSK